MTREGDVPKFGPFPRLIGVKEMAEILGVPASWLYQRTRLGAEVIPFVKVGKYVRFDPEEVMRFLKGQERRGNGPADGVS